MGHQGGHTLITGGADGTVRVWVLEDPSLAQSFTPEVSKYATRSGDERGVVEGGGGGTRTPLSLPPSDIHEGLDDGHTGPPLDGHATPTPCPPPTS